MDDYSYHYTFQARSTELADIAAMDRLAADLAPTSSLRRYAESRRAAAEHSSWTRLLERVRGTVLPTRLG